MDRQSSFGVLTRQATAHVRAVNEKSRTVELSFSSETPVNRSFGVEVLDHSSRDSADLSRLNSRASLLFNHDPALLVGVVERAMIDTASRRGRATVRFSNSALGKEKFEEVRDGILSGVSVSYDLDDAEFETTAQRGGRDVVRFKNWRPLEISLVTVPADHTVGIGRSNMKPQILRDHRTTDGGGGSRQEQERIQGIEETARRWRCPDDMVRTAIAEGLSEHEFGQRVMAFVAGQGSRGPAYPARNNDGIMRRDEGIGMSRSDMARYSIVKALRELAEGQRVSGLEREASDETARRMGIQPEGFFVPLDMMRARIGEQQRALSAGTDAAGGYTVETEVLGASLIELLRNRMVTLDLGARELMGLTSDIAIPTHTGAVTASWLAEAAADTASDQTFGQLTLTPKRISATTTISKQLIAQSSLDIESFVRRDMADTLAVELDHKALNGTGASNQPTGILNTSGIGTVTITAAGSPDWNEILEFESDVAAANADRGSLAYITTNAIRAYMKENLKVSADAGAGFLWDAPDRVNGYRAVATEQMPTNGILFGNFQDVLIASWGGLDVVVDPYTLKKNFQLEITTTLLADIGVRHAASFSKNA